MDERKALVEATPTRSLQTVKPGYGQVELLFLAEHAFKSGMFKKLPNVSAAVMVMTMGRDLGLSPSTALTNIHFFDGKPTMSGNLMWSLVTSNPEYRRSRVVKLTDKECVLRFHRVCEEETILDQEWSFTETDAKTAQLLGKDNWKKYPKAMLFNRAVSTGFKLFCPHLSMGYTIYTPDELGAPIGEDGELADHAVRTQTAQQDTAGLVKQLCKELGKSVAEVAKLFNLGEEEFLNPTDDELRRLAGLVGEKKRLEG